MGLTPNVVPLAPIASTWGNEIRDRSVQRFANAAERASQWTSPGAGALSVLADRPGFVYVYTGSAWVVQGAEGIVAAPTVWGTTTASTSASPADITNATATFEAIAGRYYRHTITGYALGSVGIDILRLTLTDAANAARGVDGGIRDYIIVHVNNATFLTLAFVELVSVDGTATRKLRLARAGGSGVVQFWADAASGRNAAWTVEDIGAL